MPVIRYAPIEEFEAMQERMNRFFEEIASGKHKTPGLTFCWVPAVDIYETDSALVLYAELPGIDPQSIDVQIQGDSLLIQGDRYFPSESKLENYYRIERSYGKFKRSFMLPKTIDAANIHAKFTDGVLMLTMPKVEKVTPQKISILFE